MVHFNCMVSSWTWLDSTCQVLFSTQDIHFPLYLVVIATPFETAPTSSSALAAPLVGDRREERLHLLSRPRRGFEACHSSCELKKNCGPYSSLAVLNCGFVQSWAVPSCTMVTQIHDSLWPIGSLQCFRVTLCYCLSLLGTLMEAVSKKAPGTNFCPMENHNKKACQVELVPCNGRAITSYRASEGAVVCWATINLHE